MPAQRLLLQSALTIVVLAFLASALGFGVGTSGLVRKGGFDPWLLLYGSTGYLIAANFWDRQMTDKERGLVLLWMMPAVLMFAFGTGPVLR